MCIDARMGREKPPSTGRRPSPMIDLPLPLQPSILRDAHPSLPHALLSGATTPLDRYPNGPGIIWMSSEERSTPTYRNSGDQGLFEHSSLAQSRYLVSYNCNLRTVVATTSTVPLPKRVPQLYAWAVVARANRVYAGCEPPESYCISGASL